MNSLFPQQEIAIEHIEPVHPKRAPGFIVEYLGEVFKAVCFGDMPDTFDLQVYPLTRQGDQWRNVPAKDLILRQVEPAYLSGINTDSLGQALTWMGVAGPVSQESYVSDIAVYINALTSAVLKHKRDSQANPAQPAHSIEHVVPNISGWFNVSERMPDNRIRVIAAHKDHTIGDCFFGSAGLMIGHCGNPGYIQERMINCWRHTKTEDAVAADQQPTQWMELPLPSAPDADKPANPEEKHGN